MEWFHIEKIDNETFAISEYGTGKKHIAIYCSVQNAPF